MKIRRFVAPDLPQAVAAVRQAMGRDAVIISTRTLRGPGWRRWLRRYDQVEIQAAIEGLPAVTARPTATEARAWRLDVRERTDTARLREAFLGPEAREAGPRMPAPVRVLTGQRRLVALVGPTGGGKTTTTAKLAAHLHLQQGWRVGLISADTFRVGGVEQLEAYARILGLPLEVAPTPAALGRALERLGETDVVLVDTSGRGHRDDRRMGELEAFLAVAREVAGASGGLEAHLVLAAPTRAQEVEAVLGRYRDLVGAVLLTKLDECEVPPAAATAAGAAGLPLSYGSAGQRVPEDLFLAWPDQVLRALPAAGRAG